MVSKTEAKKPLYKPFIKWVGGKRQLLDDLGKHYKKFFNPDNEYYEPFVGGGAVFFDLRNKFGDDFKAHLVDINEELVITYNVVKNDPEELIKKLETFQKNHNKEHYIKIREWDRKPGFKRRKDVDRAARFIYLNRTGFNGLRRVNSQGYNNVPLGKYTNPKICDVETIMAASKALQNATIEVMDFEKAIKNTKKGDFVYFDPPYDPLNKTSYFTDYAKDGFGDSDQERLGECFGKLNDKGCYVMASNNNTELIKKIYKGFKTELVNATRMVNSDASKRGAIKEIVILSSTIKKDGHKNKK